RKRRRETGSGPLAKARSARIAIAPSIALQRDNHSPGCIRRLGLGGTKARTGRDSVLLVSLVSQWPRRRRKMPEAAMIQHAAEIVRVHGRDVQSLHKRGVTWVSFMPMPDMVGGIDFAIRKLPGLGL